MLQLQFLLLGVLIEKVSGVVRLVAGRLVAGMTSSRAGGRRRRRGGDFKTRISRLVKQLEYGSFRINKSVFDGDYGFGFQGWP